MSHFQREFAVTLPAGRVRFGPGVRHDIGAEIARLGAERALILTTPRQADAMRAFATEAEGRVVDVFAGAKMHTPVSVTEDALAEVEKIGADCLVAVGGGSTTGLAKALAYRTNLPQIIVPTTYAGSEATPILGQTEDGIKTTLRDPRVQPEVILYDAKLVTGLPVAMTVTSALNAIAHAAEGLYAEDRNPLSSVMAVEGMRAFADALPRVLADPGDLDARGETLYGAWLCGSVLGQVSMALHHKLCHTLGGTFDLPHAETHAIILPHAIGFNAAAVPELLAPVAEIFGAGSAGRALHGFAARMGAPTRLSDLGLKESDLDRAAELATQNAYPNPAEITPQGVRQILEAAYCGRPPVR
ncbi:maleylacetate reductase [Marinovum sp.]|uniref:maleylacetate reductase n=1 Tax=Marinovum sp. TaxID=2024839 RepID=UPI003A8F80B7